MSKEQSVHKEKSIAMPKAEEMVQRLTKAGLYGVTPQTDDFFDSFIRRVAGTEKVGKGLTLAWTLSEYDVLRELPPIVTDLMRMDFELVIDTVTPDSQVANDAKEFLQKVYEAAKRKRDSQ